MQSLTEYLDRIAERLEARGLVRQAAQIDLIANTLDAAYIGEKFNPLKSRRMKVPEPPEEEAQKPGPHDKEIAELQAMVTRAEKTQDMYEELLRTMRPNSKGQRSLQTRAQQLQQYINQMRDNITKLELRGGKPAWEQHSMRLKASKKDVDTETES